jgi:hypothetical protein
MFGGVGLVWIRRNGLWDFWNCHFAELGTFDFKLRKLFTTVGDVLNRYEDLLNGNERFPHLRSPRTGRSHSRAHCSRR